MITRATSLDRVSSQFTEGCEELDLFGVKKKERGIERKRNREEETICSPPLSDSPSLRLSVYY
jgi:hypothetical protein